MTMEKEDKIHALTAIATRALLAARLGQQYAGSRDLYSALGYKTELIIDDYVVKYSRQDIAKAIISRPVQMTWKGDLSLIESSDDKETPLEKEFTILNERLKLKSKFARLDRLTCLGHYGILLFGLDDVKVPGDFSNPVTGTRKLLYIKPLSEKSAKIQKYETNTSSERYGLPLLYQISMDRTQDGVTIDSQSLLVHYSRVIHVTVDLLESEVEGTPVLEVVYNRLEDLEKLVGGSAEMFWRGARPGYSGKVDKEYQVTGGLLDDLKTQIDEYEHDLRRILVNEGVDLQSLAIQVADPQSHVDVQLQMISAVTGIPKRVLTGTERGELASTQDDEAWLTMIQNRREDFAEPMIVRAFVDYCIKYGILPAAKDGYDVGWFDLFAKSEKDKVEVGRTRADSLSKYIANPMAEQIIPFEAFAEFFLGLEQDQITLLKEMREVAAVEMMNQEALIQPEEEEIINREDEDDEQPKEE